MSIKRRINKYLVLLILALTSNSCYKNVAGCLDILSNNFAANADFACENCCTYPDLSFTFAFRNGDSGFSLSDTVSNGIDTFRIVNAGLYLRNFSLTNANPPIVVRESANFWFEDNGSLSEQALVTDFLDVGPTNGTSYTVGTHSRREEVSAVNFDLGLPVEWNNLFQDSIPESSRLNNANNLLYDSQAGYATAFMQIVYDLEGSGDTILYHLPTSALMTPISLDTSFLVDFGADIEIGLSVDFLEWTKGIDFETIGADVDLVKEKFVSNIPNSISLNN